MLCLFSKAQYEFQRQEICVNYVTKNSMNCKRKFGEPTATQNMHVPLWDCKSGSKYSKEYMYLEYIVSFNIQFEGMSSFGGSKICHFAILEFTPTSRSGTGNVTKLISSRLSAFFRASKLHRLIAEMVGMGMVAIIDCWKNHLTLLGTNISIHIPSHPALLSHWLNPFFNGGICLFPGG